MAYLCNKQAKVVAMTCTHAALKRREFLNLGLKYDNIVMEEAGQVRCKGQTRGCVHAAGNRRPSDNLFVWHCPNAHRGVPFWNLIAHLGICAHISQGTCPD